MEPGIKLGKHRGRYVAQWQEPEVAENGDLKYHRRRHQLGVKYCAENIEEAERRLAEFSSRFETSADATVFTVWHTYKMNKDAERDFYAEKNLLPFFGTLDTNQISVSLCRAYTNKRRKAGVRDGTIRRELSTLKAAVRKFAPKGHRDFVFELPPASPPRDRYVTREEFKVLRKAVAPTQHVALFVEVAIATGARKSAICQLKWSQVDFERRLIDLQGEEGEAANKRRAVVPITESLFAKLIQAKSIAMTDNVIEYNGESIKRIDIAFRRRVKTEPSLSGVTPHVLRHSAAVWMAEAGVPMSQIAQYLGHTSTKITESVYARYSPDFLRHAAAALNV